MSRQVPETTDQLVDRYNLSKDTFRVDVTHQNGFQVIGTVGTVQGDLVCCKEDTGQDHKFPWDDGHDVVTLVVNDTSDKVVV